MTYSELMNLVLNSRREDWLRQEGRGVYVLKSDLNVTVREKPEELRPFTEEWATRFPDRKAYSRVFELWYGGSFIKEYGFASVDGDRARLPYPEFGTNIITREQYAIARAVDVVRGLNEYIRRARLVVHDVENEY